MENESSAVLCDLHDFNFKKPTKKGMVVKKISSKEVACGPMKHQHTVGLMTPNKMPNQL